VFRCHRMATGAATVPVGSWPICRIKFADRSAAKLSGNITLIWNTPEGLSGDAPLYRTEAFSPATATDTGNVSDAKLAVNGQYAPVTPMGFVNPPPVPNYSTNGLQEPVSGYAIT